MLRNVTVLRFLSKVWMPISKKIIIIGGDLVGLELAEFLIERGRKVKVSGYKKAIITLKKGQSIDLTTGI